MLLFDKVIVTQATIVEGVLKEFTGKSGHKVNVNESKAFFSPITRRIKIDYIVFITCIGHWISREVPRVPYDPREV